MHAEHVVRVAGALQALELVVGAADDEDAVRQEGRERRAGVTRHRLPGQRRVAALGEVNVDEPSARDDVGLADRAQAARDGLGVRGIGRRVVG